MNWKFNKDGWTDWIEHDGKGCPCVGWWVDTRANRPGRCVNTGVVTDAKEYLAVGKLRSWSRSNHPYFVMVVKYRIRKPKGAEMLERIAMDTDMPILEDA